MQGARDLSFLEILSESHPTANNHVLNSLLIKALFSLGTNSLGSTAKLFTFINNLLINMI